MSQEISAEQRERSAAQMRARLFARRIEGLRLVARARGSTEESRKYALRTLDLLNELGLRPGPKFDDELLAKLLNEVTEPKKSELLATIRDYWIKP